MVTRTHSGLKVGDRVLVPWGVEQLEAEIIEIWGEPAAHVRVALQIEDGDEPEYLLLNPSVLTPLAA